MITREQWSKLSLDQQMSYVHMLEEMVDEFTFRAGQDAAVLNRIKSGEVSAFMRNYLEEYNERQSAILQDTMMNGDIGVMDAPEPSSFPNDDIDRWYKQKQVEWDNKPLNGTFVWLGARWGTHK